MGEGRRSERKRGRKMGTVESTFSEVTFLLEWRREGEGREEMEEIRRGKRPQTVR
jgi:hypothetical protein